MKHVNNNDRNLDVVYFNGFGTGGLNTVAFVGVGAGSFTINASNYVGYVYNWIAVGA